MNLVKINTLAPQALMIPEAAKRFNQLRQIVLDGSGVDFLSKCSDVFRNPDFVSSKDGVANRSWHKTGRTFDYDQTSHALLVVPESIGGKQFFRTWLICSPQSGKLGVQKTLHDYRAFTKTAYVFDFTAAALAQGFNRIPAWAGWQTHYNRREFWHYQFDQGMTWDAAMKFLKGEPVVQAVVGLNDRGDAVKRIQTALAKAGFLPTKEIDGIFGAQTKAAVVAFQQSKGFIDNGLVNDQTRKALGV
jgi:hypothetical protein